MEEIKTEVVEKEAHVKTCSCGKTYTQEQWDALPLVGYQTFDLPGVSIPPLELRNCSCDSTMALPKKK